MLRNLCLFALSLNFLACASYFTRKTCEKTNWYQHGYKVAMGGERLNADNFVKQCESVEAAINYEDLDIGFKKGMGNYCLPTTVYRTGKSGAVFKEDLCDSGGISKLRAKYQEGLKVFCTPTSAYRFAVKGGVYADVCPASKEASFMPKYRKGRGVYLKGVISDKEKEIRNIERKIGRKKNDRNRLDYRLSTEGGRRTFKSREAKEEDEATKMRRQRLVNQINSVNREIRQLESKQDSLRSQIQNLRQEQRSLRAENS